MLSVISVENISQINRLIRAAAKSASGMIGHKKEEKNGRNHTGGE